MPNRSSKRPADLNQLAKFVVDQATGAIESPITEDGKNAAAVALGRLGGLKGGKARAISLSEAERSQIAAKAARARWDRAGKQGAGNVKKKKGRKHSG